MRHAAGLFRVAYGCVQLQEFIKTFQTHENYYGFAIDSDP